MKLKIMAYCLLGILLVGMLGACSQPAQPQDNTDISEFEFVPDGLSLSSTTAPRMVVRLGMYKDSVTNLRSGKVVVAWSDQGDGNNLTGTISLKLRQVGSTTTLAELNNAAIDSAYLAPTIVQTDGTSQKGPLCVEVTAWDLSAGAYTFNTQSLPLVFCGSNTTETGSDLAVSLDANSETSGVLTRTFPFVIATQNLGKQRASDVVVTVTLPTELEFVSEDSIAYDCTATTATVISCALNRVMPVSRWGLPLMLKGNTVTAGADVSVAITTTSTDPNPANNSFTQAVSVTNICGAALFPDANLRAVVKSTLSITNDADLCVDDMGGVTSLDARESNISNLSGLEYATNLTQLYLGWGAFSQNYISDISVLAGLTNLTTLELNGNQITDISALAGLTNLTTLDLGWGGSSNQITDISALAGLTNLQSLDLAFNQITDISALVSNSGLGSGDVVGLTYNSLDLTPGSADWLNILTLQNRGVTVDPSVTNICGAALFPDANLKAAVKSALSITNDADLCIDDMGSLTSLSGFFSNISNLSGLEYATNLTNLDLAFNQITDISALVSNSGLGLGDVIYLDFNPLSTQAISNIALLQGRGAFVTY